MAEKITNPAIEKERKELKRVSDSLNNYRLQVEDTQKLIITSKTELVATQKEVEATKKVLKASQKAQKDQEDITAETIKKGQVATDLLRETQEDLEDTRKNLKTSRRYHENEGEAFIKYKEDIEKAKLKIMTNFKKACAKVEELMQ